MSVMGNARQKLEKDWRPNLKDAPAFYPTEEEFEDPLNYIASIRPRAEMFGVCRIVPPASWKPPCPLKEREIWESHKFETRAQRVDKLQNRSSSKRRTKKRKYNKSYSFEEGPEFTIESFQNYANDFEKQYFAENIGVGKYGNSFHEKENEPSVEDIEEEYWRVVEDSTDAVEVLYGADLDNSKFGSGFPLMSDQNFSISAAKYIKSGWNLNNLPKLPGSLLPYESSDITGVVVPWLYLGMCFSSFCWHVEDHHLYSVNYLHWGAPKLWYGVPGTDALQFEAAMRKCLPDLFAKQPNLLHLLVTQLSPSVLQSEGVAVFRCVQNPGEFVLTFPRAYHAGFNCGFNCAEAVNVAPIDWLPHGQAAVELYAAERRKTNISHDKLLLGAANEAVKAQCEHFFLKKITSDNLKWKDATGKDGVLAQALKKRVAIEFRRRNSLPRDAQILKMEKDFDSLKEKECSVCLYDLHMSAACCHCSPDKFACLEHADKLCKCGWDGKMLLFRHSMTELYLLVEAVEGKLSSFMKWAEQELGWGLGSDVKDKNLGVPGQGA